MLGSSRVAAQLAASREGLGSMNDDDDTDSTKYRSRQAYFLTMIQF
jgi:hypothetical protein